MSLEKVLFFKKSFLTTYSFSWSFSVLQILKHLPEIVALWFYCTMIHVFSAHGPGAHCAHDAILSMACVGQSHPAKTGKARSGSDRSTDLFQTCCVVTGPGSVCGFSSQGWVLWPEPEGPNNFSPALESNSLPLSLSQKISSSRFVHLEKPAYQNNSFQLSLLRQGES